MIVARKFVLALLVWGLGVFLLILPVELLAADPPGALTYLRWLGQALGIAMFPAGIAIADDVFGASNRWRALGAAAIVTVVAAALGFVLFALVLPALGEGRTLAELAAAMQPTNDSWEARNDAAWNYYRALLMPVEACLITAVGLQLGLWAPHALPPLVRRLAYWGAALGIIVGSVAVTDSTYETVVLHTADYVDFAAFYRLLLPLGICAGFALPTLAVLQGAELRGSHR